uniref:SP-RING-type domain-containing protein n=1 Tax=Ascaris lumbricoides TaxID=6252 RepID=A0A0M3IXS7_ASCLU
MPTLHLLPAERRSDTNCRKRLLANVRARRDMIVTKMAIRTQLRDRGDSSLHLERVEFMLLCPLGKTRIVTPAKGSECSHLKCFDLMLFLKMNEKSPTWKCPICDKAVPYNKIIVDGYSIFVSGAPYWQLGCSFQGNLF